jgi:hypothetical protein
MQRAHPACSQVIDEIQDVVYVDPTRARRKVCTWPQERDLTPKDRYLQVVEDSLAVGIDESPASEALVVDRRDHVVQDAGIANPLDRPARTVSQFNPESHHRCSVCESKRITCR